MSHTDPAASIRRVVVHPEGVQVEVVPEPVPSAEEALIAMTLTGVCGSDTHAAHGRHPFMPLPYLPGHEVVGIVTSVGTDVSAVEPGDRVTIEPTLPCDRCKTCRQGDSNICENLAVFGCTFRQGGMADRFTIDAGRLHVLPDSLDDTTAALIEPLATPVHAMRLAGGVKDRSIVIIGAGTIGLLTLAAARHLGAKRIVVTDLLSSKGERALALGADATFVADSPTLVDDVRNALGEGADVVFDCVSVQATVDQGFAMAGKGSTVVIIGIPAEDVRIPLPVLQDHQMRIQGAATYLPEDYETSIAILESGAIKSDDIVTALLPLERAAEAFALSGSPEHVKVLMRP